MAANNPHQFYGVSGGGTVVASDPVTGLWRRVEQSLDIMYPSAIEVSSTDDNHLALVAGNYMPRSFDGGTTWQIESTPAEIGDVIQIRMAPTDHQVRYARGDKVARSLDGGDTWTQIFQQIQVGRFTFLTVSPVDPATLIIGVPGQGLYRSTDYGSTWQELTPPTPFFINSAIDLLEIDNLNPSHVYLSYGRGLFHSTDAGESWTDITGNLEVLLHSGIGTILTDPFVPGRLLVASPGLAMHQSDPSTGEWSMLGDSPAEYCDSTACQLRADPVNRGRFLQVSGGELYEYLSDTDNDAIADMQDNCVNHANPDQYDSNGDGFGNACDADYNNNGVVNITDLGILKAAFSETNPDADHNGNGVINFTDLAIFKSLFLQPPGPSGLVPP